MSLQAKILNLIAGITDPALRLDIATTINFLFQVFMSGRASEREIKESLFEIAYDVISMTHPELTEEEVRKKAWAFADDMIRAFRLEIGYRRALSRFSFSA